MLNNPDLVRQLAYRSAVQSTLEIEQPARKENGTPKCSTTAKLKGYQYQSGNRPEKRNAARNDCHIMMNLRDSFDLPLSLQDKTTGRFEETSTES